MQDEKQSPDVRAFVRQRYGEIATSREPSTGASLCCSTTDGSACCQPSGDLILQVDTIAKIFPKGDATELPLEVTQLSLGCGDPVTLASLQPGQVVLDLGSGGGIDCFLAARRVGPTGRVIGVDMTPSMLERARANKDQLQAENVEFRLGEIEHLPVADESIDVIISNCVINLSPDKQQVIGEAFRVLKPGGRLAVSDMVTNGPLPESVKKSLSAWASCIAGAIDANDLAAIIEQVGFIEVNVEPASPPPEDIDPSVTEIGSNDLPDLTSDAILKTVFSAKITALKPK